MINLILTCIVALAILTAAVLLGRPWLGRYRMRKMRTAREKFQQRREWLEAQFLSIASNSGRPRGLEWTDCEFENPVSFARDRSTGQLRALVGVNISFAAIEGGGMEDVEAVGDIRAATAVFRFDGSHWHTDGRAVFNLSPNETIQRFHHELESVSD